MLFNNLVPRKLLYICVCLCVCEYKVVICTGSTIKSKCLNTSSPNHCEKKKMAHLVNVLTVPLTLKTDNSFLHKMNPVVLNPL